MFFPLSQSCTIQRDTSTTSRSGQKVQSWANHKVDVPTLWFTSSGNRNTSTVEEFDQIATIYFEPSVDVAEGDRIINVKDAYGVVFESGPYLVVAVKRYGDLAGFNHHQTVKIRGISS